MYFTHKNKEDDWEVMALEFVPAEKEAVSDGSDMLVGGEVTAEPDYVETDVTVGQAPYTLEGVLAMPKEASEETPVPACVFVHDFGAYDRDLTMGQTTFFADLAGALGEMGVASLRYDSPAPMPTRMRRRKPSGTKLWRTRWPPARCSGKIRWWTRSASCWWAWALGG